MSLLRLNLNATDTPPRRYRLPRRSFLAMAFLIWTAVLASLSVLLVLLFFLGLSVNPCLIYVIYPIIGYGMVTAYRWAGKSVKLVKRFATPDANTLMAKDRRPPILYLYPFRDKYAGDNLLADVESDENFLLLALKGIGPVVAVGRPGEVLPPLGAARLYLDTEDDWRGMIKGYMSRSRFVVISPDYTEGVMWETETAISYCPPEKIIISLIPFQPNEKNYKGEETYKRFRDSFEVKTGIILPEKIGKAVFLCFDSDRTPKLLEPPGNHSTRDQYLESAQFALTEEIVSFTLLQLFRDRGIKPPRSIVLRLVFIIYVRPFIHLFPFLLVLMTFIIHIGSLIIRDVWKGSFSSLGTILFLSIGFLVIYFFDRALR